MPNVVPDYYNDFKCIADRCQHNCCIGWEIDIDSDSLDFYRSVSGDFGKRLSANISRDAQPHFILTDNERCPFLNHKNLCDIITELGKNRLCDICRDHPRFRNELPGRIEEGIGLSCEEAARIIITKRDKATLLYAPDTDDEILLLRDRIIEILQNREKDIFGRIKDMFSLLSIPFEDFDIAAWACRLLRLERLEPIWGDMLQRISEICALPDIESFDRYMQDRQSEYEQLLVYIIFRHFAIAPTLSEAKKRAKFSAFVFFLLRAMGAAMFADTGKFTTENQIELARMFSAEIEYSDENLYLIIDSF